MNIDYDLKRIKIFVKQLGEELVSLQKKSLQVDVKADGTKVTNGDFFSHQELSNFLSQHFPYPIISEEQTNPRYFPKGIVWVIDPIDGTNSFIKGKGDFAIMLALVHDYKPLFSLVYLPAHRMGYFAELGKGSYRYVNEGKEVVIKIDKETPLAKRVFQSSGVNSYVEEHSWFNKHNIYNHETSRGIGRKVCLIAEGSSHYYLNFKRKLKVWDVMPSVLIVQEAGGWVASARGGRVVYDKFGYEITQGLCVAPDSELESVLR